MRPHLIILHGALGAKQQFSELSKILNEKFIVHSFNFEGHGGRPTEHLYTIELFTQNLIDYVVAKELNKPFVFGYSMGGYVALNASHQGLQFQKLLTLGTKFDWTPEIAQKEIKLLNPKTIKEKVPKFAEYLAALHEPEDWNEVMHKTVQMMIGLGNEPTLTNNKLQNINLRTLCCLGSEDKMVTQEETKNTVSKLRNAEFYSFQGFEHSIEKVDITILARKIIDFFQSV